MFIRRQITHKPLERRMREADSAGWVVNDSEARDAYEFACGYFDKDDLNQQIVDSLNSRELAASLAFLFRMNDFREWDNRNNPEERFHRSR